MMNSEYFQGVVPAVGQVAPRDRLLDKSLDSVCMVGGILMTSNPTPSELDALRLLLGNCAKARDSRNLGSMLVVLAVTDDLLKSLAASSDKRPSLIAVVEALGSFETPDICTWRKQLSEITDAMHEFIDSLALVVPVSMNRILQELATKVTDVLEIGNLKDFADCVNAFSNLPTAVVDEVLRAEVQSTVDELLTRLKGMPLEHTLDLTCACGECLS